MSTTLKAIEASGTLNQQNQITLDKPLRVKDHSRVKVIILFLEDQEIDETDWLKAVSANPAFDFLKDPEEDIYTVKDGKPFNDQG